MSFQKLIGVVFAILFIVILYIIIYYALKIMYKDVKGGNRVKGSSNKEKLAYGLEVVNEGQNSNLKKGSLIHVRNTVTIGRKDDNSIILSDTFVSGNHAKLYVRNNEFYLEDLDSTNGTYINNQKLQGRMKLKMNDEIKIGTVVFKVM
ncbi:FHA domain-containing protein [Clostridium intestinale]|uniref:FHA-domain containing protein n=1 Tax=Clostridium intestinale URNW TaxID=1294142 RepID=U2PRX8_9CLOT|nr:FHA domain-containing protein [Clostridium intestinale]ERK29205.1 FHA-domain containing protein [Clostridium intestinale URNW]